MSGDSEQEYFADGMSEDIITALSKIPLIFVIARNSSFVFQGQGVPYRRNKQEAGRALHPRRQRAQSRQPGKDNGAAN